MEPSEEGDSSPEASEEEKQIFADAQPLITYHRNIADGSYVGVHLCHGFRFVPTDQELISYYLNRKIDNVQADYLTHIIDINIYQHSPDELAEKNPYFVEDTGYFFSPRERRWLGETLPNRAARKGHWMTIEAETEICDQNKVCIGFKTCLDFRQWNGKKTNWVMHEYVANRPRPPPQDMRLDECVLYRIFKLPEWLGQAKTRN